MARKFPPAATKAAMKSRPKPDKNAPLGEGGRFAAMVKSGKSPALAAYIGRKSLGKAKFQKLAAAGRKKQGKGK